MQLYFLYVNDTSCTLYKRNIVYIDGTKGINTLG